MLETGVSNMKVKCRWCGEKTERELMVFEEKNNKKLYFHKECYSDYLKDKEFKEQERKEKDALVETIKRIYGVQDLPRQVYPFLEDLRNGNPVFKGQQPGKRYKQGYKYSVIKEAFEYCENQIQYAIQNKDFDGFMNAFKYGLAIVIDKIYKVDKMIESRNRQKAIESTSTFVPEFEMAYNRKAKNENDISEFLDDEGDI